jgi:hypothetical protein
MTEPLQKRKSIPCFGLTDIVLAVTFITIVGDTALRWNRGNPRLDNSIFVLVGRGRGLLMRRGTHKFAVVTQAMGAGSLIRIASCRFGDQSLCIRVGKYFKLWPAVETRNGVLHIDLLDYSLALFKCLALFEFGRIRISDTIIANHASGDPVTVSS